MASITTQTKKVTDLTAATAISDSNYFLIHDGSGLKKITAGAVKSRLFENNAAAHNAIYRGKSLGASVTDAQYAEISAGTFKDMYIGDYWTINSVKWTIAAFDYWHHKGDSDLDTHHLLIVPAYSLYTAQMNNTEGEDTTSTTEGGYTGSDMYTTNLAPAKTTIKSIFGDHVLSHKDYLTTATANGAASNAAWFDSEVELMNEIMVYGSYIRTPQPSIGLSPTVMTCCTKILPIMLFDQKFQNPRSAYWLRDVTSAATFAAVSFTGHATTNGSSATYGVRPFFLLS